MHMRIPQMDALVALCQALALFGSLNKAKKKSVTKKNKVQKCEQVDC